MLTNEEFIEQRNFEVRIRKNQIEIANEGKNNSKFLRNSSTLMTNNINNKCRIN